LSTATRSGNYLLSTAVNQECRNCITRRSAGQSSNRGGGAWVRVAHFSHRTKRERWGHTARKSKSPS